MFFIDLSSIPTSIRVVLMICFYALALVLYCIYRHYHKVKENKK